MNRLGTFTVLLLAATCIEAQDPAPIIDNDRVTVWESNGTQQAVQHDFVAVSLTDKGSAVFGRKGDTAGSKDARTVIIELKDPVELKDPNAPAVPNESSYPHAFPRPHAQKLLENSRVIVWSYRWYPGEPTPLHVHDKDVVVVYEEDTALTSISPDGNTIANDYKDGEVRFNKRGRIHSEQLAHGTGSAVITELK